MPRIFAMLIGASLLGGCSYFPIPPDPIRIVDSPSDVAACRNLGVVSLPVPTNGTWPVVISSLTVAPPRGTVITSAPPTGGEPSGPGFVYSLNAMRDAALARGATDLLLRRVRRDWSFVEGVAYRCRH
jgi:hypothetical protein